MRIGIGSSNSKRWFKSGAIEDCYDKPQTEEEKPNKWCVRQCERSVLLDDVPNDFTNPEPNIRRKD